MPIECCTARKSDAIHFGGFVFDPDIEVHYWSFPVREKIQGFCFKLKISWMLGRERKRDETREREKEKRKGEHA